MIDCTVKTLNQLWRTPEDGEQGCFTRRMFIHLTRHWTQKTSGNAINVSEFKKQNPWVSESEESHPPTIIHRNSPSLIIIIVIYWNQHLFLWPSSSQSSSSSSASSHHIIHCDSWCQSTKNSTTLDELSCNQNTCFRTIGVRPELLPPLKPPLPFAWFSLRWWVSFKCSVAWKWRLTGCSLKRGSY